VSSIPYSKPLPYYPTHAFCFSFLFIPFIFFLLSCSFCSLSAFQWLLSVAFISFHMMTECHCYKALKKVIPIFMTIPLTLAREQKLLHWGPLPDSIISKDIVFLCNLSFAQSVFFDKKNTEKGQKKKFCFWSQVLQCFCKKLCCIMLSKIINRRLWLLAETHIRKENGNQ
jgi:hypothetical protein